MECSPVLFLLKKHVVTDSKNWRIAAERMVTHYTNRPFMAEQVVHCTTLWSVAKRRDFFLIQIVVGGRKLSWHLVLNPFFTLK